MIIAVGLIYPSTGQVFFTFAFLTSGKIKIKNNDEVKITWAGFFVIH